MANLNDTITDGTAKFKVVKSATSNDVSDHNNLATAHSNGISGNAATATKLKTARTINIQDSSATNTGTGASFDGSGNATIKLPATIKANITGNVTGNCSGSSGSCTGNAATATKATGDKNGKDIAATYLPLTGGTMSGVTKLKAYSQVYSNFNWKTDQPTSAIISAISYCDNDNNALGYSETYMNPNGHHGIRLVLPSSHTDPLISTLGMEWDGTKFVSYATPVDAFDSSNKIATTKYVRETAAKQYYVNYTIFVSNAPETNGDGSTAEKAMNLGRLKDFLAAMTMNSAYSNFNNSYRLTIKFVPTGINYSDVYFDSNKMPGVKYITIDTSTGIDSTLSNYETNSPLFNSLTVTGPLSVTIRNIEIKTALTAYSSSYVYLHDYVGFDRITANGGCITFNSGIYNIHNGNVDYCMRPAYNGYMNLNTGGLLQFNFRDQCYYYGDTFSFFRPGGSSELGINFSQIKNTGYKPICIGKISMTLTGTSSTASATQTKDVALASGQTFTLTTNAVACIKFTNTNTAANPKLNINGTGAKPIVLPDGTAIPANYLGADIPYKFTYNGTNYVCNNNFTPRLIVATNRTDVITIGNHYTTYNGGEWNWDGYDFNFTNFSRLNDKIPSGILQENVKSVTVPLNYNSDNIATTKWVIDYLKSKNLIT